MRPLRSHTLRMRGFLGALRPRREPGPEAKAGAQACLRTDFEGPGPTTFIGVSSDPTRGVEPILGGSGLYEFWTADERHVYLHDMHFRDMAYSAGPAPQLRMTFEWAEPPVPESYAGPVVELTFGDVRMCDWRENPDHSADRTGATEVTFFDYRADGVFWMLNHTVYLAFAARTCQVDVHD